MKLVVTTKQLLDFNPDARVVVRNGNNPSADFILAWGELNENGIWHLFYNI